ncbi:putative hemagglutination activity domain protein [Acinetobacter sp. CAG:196]|nr:putative hemagglutination activity domain protein [Acinetobacter sp. CAG:196]
MRKNIKTLLCVTAFVGAMSSGIAFADNLTISSGSTETISQEATYDNIINAGTLNNNASLTVETSLQNSSSINNSSSIVTTEITNQSGASITGVSGSIEISNGGTNDGSITQNIVNVTAGTLTNSGTISAETFNNSGQLTGTGKLIAAGGSNSTTIEQDTIEITGNYTNNGTMTANKEFTNASSDITGNGSLIIKDSTGNSSNGGSISQAIVNISGNKFTNTGSITASQEFTNSAAIEGAGSISASQGGTNTGSITQNEVTTGGTFNNGDGTTAGTITTDKLTNNGTFNNNSGSSIISDEIINNDKFINNGSIGSSPDKGTIDNKGTFTNNGSIIASTITNETGKEFINNSGNEITADSFTNQGSVTNNGTINAGSLNNSSSITGNTGSLTISNGGTISGTISQKIVSVTGGTLNNENSITANEFNNSATISGSGSLTATTGNNSGNITQDNVTIKGDYTNTGTITSNDNFTNSGNISGGGGKLIVNKGSNSGSISQDTLETSGTFENTGSIIANITNGGTFTNNGTIGTNQNKAEITNNGTFTNNNSVIASAITNNADKTFTNAGNVVTDTITNNGTFDGKGSITIGGGENTGTITQNNITINGNFANNGDMTANNSFSNSADITGGGNLNINNGNNTGNITQGEITVDGKLTNTGGSISAGSIANNGTISLENGSSLEITGSDGTLGGIIDAIGTGNNLAAGNNNVTGTINIGNSSTASDLTLESGNVVADAVVNITQNGEFKLEGGETTLNSNDTWAGKVSLNGGNLTTNVTQNGILDADTGELTVGSGSLTIGQGSSIAGDVTTEIADGTTLNINNGGEVTLNSGDNWNGTVSLNGGKLDVSGLTANETLHGNSGDLIAGTGNLNIGTGSYIENEVAIQTSGNINITGDGIVGIDDNDTLASSSVISLKNNGTLNYGNTQNPSFKIEAESGNLNLLEKSNMTIDDSSSIADAVALDIQKNATLTLASAEINLDKADKWNGIIDNQGGTINTDNVTQSSSTAALIQNAGTTNIDNTSNITLGEKSEISGGDINITNNSVLNTVNANITGGNMTIDENSAFVVKNGTFELDKIIASGDGAMQNALIHTMNGERNMSSIGELNIANQANFNIDIHARSNQITSNDQFMVGSMTGDGVARIDQWSLNGDIFGWDAPIDRNIVLDHIFVDKDGNPLEGNIEITRDATLTPIGWYQLNQHGSGAGALYSLDMIKFNPHVFRGQVTTIAQWQNQLAIDDMLFTHSMVLPSFKDEDGGVASSGLMANRYAATNPLFAPYQYSRKDGGLWYKMYGNFENLNMNLSGLGRVGNNSYGALIGADFGLKELKNGWKFMPTAYIGYNGAHQTYPGVGAYQNGGQAGFLGTWYKNNWIIGNLVYGGIYDNVMNVGGHADNTFNYFAGAATKFAYNWRFHRDWVLQPNFMAAYNFFGQQNWHSDYGQMGMMAGMLNGVNVAPGINLIWEKETFSIYGTLQYMYNVNGAVGGQAGNVGLPQLEMERGYIQYGIGFTKKFTDRFSGYLQAVLRNAGRTGCGFQMGFNFLLGK